jgi:hypothetical protein
MTPLSTLLPDGVAAQSGYSDATTENITRLWGDPDVSGGLGFSFCPSGMVVSQMRDLEVAGISDCVIEGMR